MALPCHRPGLMPWPGACGHSVGTSSFICLPGSRGFGDIYLLTLPGGTGALLTPVTAAGPAVCPGPCQGAELRPRPQGPDSRPKHDSASQGITVPTQLQKLRPEPDRWPLVKSRRVSPGRVAPSCAPAWSGTMTASCPRPESRRRGLDRGQTGLGNRARGAQGLAQGCASVDAGGRPGQGPAPARSLQLLPLPRPASWVTLHTPSPSCREALCPHQSPPAEVGALATSGTALGGPGQTAPPLGRSLQLSSREGRTVHRCLGPLVPSSVAPRHQPLIPRTEE